MRRSTGSAQTVNAASVRNTRQDSALRYRVRVPTHGPRETPAYKKLKKADTYKRASARTRVGTQRHHRHTFVRRSASRLRRRAILVSSALYCCRVPFRLEKSTLLRHIRAWGQSCTTDVNESDAIFGPRTNLVSQHQCINDSSGTCAGPKGLICRRRSPCSRPFG